jgi:putative ABC transport system substrate-binding protein
MRRREFITLLGGGAVAWPLAATAQQPERMRRIGVLSGSAESDVRDWLTAFKAELQKRGWEQGSNIRIDYRFGAGDNDRLEAYAAELVGMVPDVLFAVTATSLVALHRQTSSVPIVFAQVGDPVKLGVVASLAHPGGNITGFAIAEHAIASKWFELLKDIAPGTTRVAVISDPENANHVPYLAVAEVAAPSFGMQLIRAPVRNAGEIERAVAALAQEPDGGLIVLPSVPALIHRDIIISLAARHRLPAVYPYRIFTSSGGLISYGVDLADGYRQAASYVNLILRGTKPGDLPVQLPTKFELAINLKTAKALGIDIPATLLGRADEVIE